MGCMFTRVVPRLLLCLPLAAGFGSVAAQAVRELPDSSGIRAPYPAVRVPPVGGAAATPVLPPQPPVPPAPLVVPRASVITQCDPTGCWDSSGRRLNRVGPGLAGPGGPCTVQGNSAMCP
jgi:hypothetical protein